ncbi:hypothetical protein [Pseudomonas fluorescens]|uniref:Transmembrane protein n=1 Tax=Pseudomonas fluorescens TaxID=294 RepID=A0A4Y9TCU2_PSEFL|nr:hypothetical protein [Pseudomonas fluorescens]TFW40902.1 hypothetical protein E4T65_23940 [Pseudomonas fluorescens]
MRMTFGGACRNASLMAAVYFLYVGFEKGNFDVFGWYGEGWLWGDWMVLVVLTSLFGVALLCEYWVQRKRAKNRKSEQIDDFE